MSAPRCKYARMVGYHMDYCGADAEDVESGFCKKHLGVVRAQEKRRARREAEMQERSDRNDRRREALKVFREACEEIGETNPEFMGKYAAVKLHLRMEFE